MTFKQIEKEIGELGLYAGNDTHDIYIANEEDQENNLILTPKGSKEVIFFGDAVDFLVDEVAHDLMLSIFNSDSYHESVNVYIKDAYMETVAI